MNPDDKKLESRDITHLLNKGDIFIDCGANIGQETIPAAQKGAIVYAFEPNIHAYNALVEATKDFSDVYCFNQGVLDKNDTMKLYYHESSDADEVMWSTGSSLVKEKKNVSKEKFIEVEVIDLVEFIEKLDKDIKILKIDVEGAEYDILEKLITSPVLSRIGQVLVETHAEKIPELREKDAAIREKVKHIGNINLNWI